MAKPYIVEMSPRFARRRLLWWSTRLGRICLFVLLTLPPMCWWFAGEAFLTLTDRKQDAQVLVVEGWIGLAGMRAASVEFQQGGYHHIVTTGGLTSARWSERRWNYADMAQHELVSAGVAPERILVARATDADSQRTRASAVAVWRTLAAADVRPAAVNIFTLGVHARRSRLVFVKTASPDTQVGVIAWMPPEFAATPWWQSSERTKELVVETVSYIFETASLGFGSALVGATKKNATPEPPRDL